MRTCSECTAPISDDAQTCSVKCRTRRHRRLRRERADALIQAGGPLLVLDDATRLRLADALDDKAGLPPAEVSRERWRAICAGSVFVLGLSEVRAAISYYPGIGRALRLPTGGRLVLEDEPRGVRGVLRAVAPLRD